MNYKTLSEELRERIPLLSNDDETAVIVENFLREKFIPIAKPEPKSRATLYKKKAAVMGRLESVQETGKHLSQNWTYATAEDIARAVRRAMAAEGLSMSFEVVSEDEPQINGKMITVKMWMRFTLECGETGATKSTSIIAAASGYDWDKVYNKAYTQCEKYWLRKTFLIDSRDDMPDPDGDENGKPAQKGEKPKRQQKQPPPETKPEKLPDWLDAFYLKAEMDYCLDQDEVKTLLKIGGVTGWQRDNVPHYQQIIDTQMSQPSNAPAVYMAANNYLKRRQFENFHNLLSAMRKHFDMANWNFPAVGDESGWADTYAGAIAYGEDNPSDKATK